MNTSSHRAAAHAGRVERRSTRARHLLPVLLLPLGAAVLACERTTEPTDAAAASAASAAVATAAGDRSGDAFAGARAAASGTFRITVTNVSGALQPLTPSVVVLHNPAADLFTVGAPASEGVERIAESGNLDPLLGALGSIRQVFDYGVAFGMVDGAPGPILPGQSGHVVLAGPPGLRISLVSMLVCTNDGFTGLDGVRLPNRVGESVTFETDGYDAGTEQNTEAAGDIVPPCVMATTGMPGGTGADQPSIAENEVIRHHPGIDGDTDGDDILDGRHQWTDPVASITIERIG